MRKGETQDLLILIVSSVLVVCFTVIFLSGRGRTGEERMVNYLKCRKDLECKGDRVCDGGVCVYPRKNFVPYGVGLSDGVSENK